jgi:hypothetical protein
MPKCAMESLGPMAEALTMVQCIREQESLAGLLREPAKSDAAPGKGEAGHANISCKEDERQNPGVCLAVVGSSLSSCPGSEVTESLC